MWQGFRPFKMAIAHCAITLVLALVYYNRQIWNQKEQTRKFLNKNECFEKKN